MNGSSSTGAFGTGTPIESIWRAMEQARSRMEKRVGSRVGRGDVRSAVLALLAEQPMHGYQIIREIEERSGGDWKPSPGSVYPTLQLLADEGLITADEQNGRKTYTLTDAGRASVSDHGTSAPWHESDHVDFGALPKAGLELAQAAAQVGRSGTPEQIRKAVAELEDVRRRLYAILAQD